MLITPDIPEDPIEIADIRKIETYNNELNITYNYYEGMETGEITVKWGGTVIIAGIDYDMMDDGTIHLNNGLLNNAQSNSNNS